VTACIVRLLSENGGSYRADDHMTVTQ
jgi:hypothetical protein